MQGKHINMTEIKLKGSSGRNGYVGSAIKDNERKKWFCI